MRPLIIALFCTLIAGNVNGQSSISAEDTLRIEKFKLVLPADQLNQFEHLALQQQSFPYELDDGEWIVPVFREMNNKLLAVPQSYSSDQSLIKSLSIPTATFRSAATNSTGDLVVFRIDGIQHSLRRESIDTLYFNSEIALQRDLFERQMGILKSVAPGEIKPISELPGHNPSKFTPEVIEHEQRWSDSLCNEARERFHARIESRMPDMFATLGEDGVLLGGHSLEDRETLAKVAGTYDRECLLTLSQAIQLGKISPEYEKRIAIITKDGWPLCGALRVERDKYITARHCFFSPRFGFSEDYTSSLISGTFQNRIQVYNLDNLDTPIRVSKLLFDNSLIGSSSASYEISDDYLFFETIEQTASLDPNLSSTLETDTPGIIHEPLLLIGYFAFHNPNWRFQIPGGTVQPWQKGLRLTKGSYCRIFDRSRDDLCISHGCQSMALFSGGPLTGQMITVPSTDLPQIKMLGVHSRAGSSPQGCGSFVQTKSRRPATGPQGGLAVSSEWIFNYGL